MYKLIYSPSALKQLEKLEHGVKERIIVALERLRLRPETCNIRKLIGMKGYRLRVGDYRIIMDVDKNKLIILVIKIGYRKKIYNRL